MRVPIMLLALGTAPLFAAAAQDRAASIQDAGLCVVADANRSATSASTTLPDDPLGRTRKGCSPTAPVTDPPPPPTTSGTGSLSGLILNDANNAPLSGWVVQLSGAVSATAVTDGTGSFLFSNLPAGTYTVCEEIPSGWVEAYPTSGTSCPTGFGYTYTLADNGGASFYFWNRAM